MGSDGEKSLTLKKKSFHLLHHRPYQKQQQLAAQELRDEIGVVVPKGCLAIKVGLQGKEQQRFVVPVIYFNHPLFMHLLKEAEEEYGFHQKGTITIPCHVEQFRNVRGIIDREKTQLHYHHYHHIRYCFGF